MVVPGNPSTYSTIDHTADMGIRIFGKDRMDLFANAALALADLLVSSIHPGTPTSASLHVAGADLVDLLIRWMGEVLYLFEGESLLVTDVRIQTLTSTRLDAEVGLLPFDPKRDEPLNAVKAVTYHQARITEKDGKWEALVILDV